MTKLDRHPTVVKYRESAKAVSAKSIDSETLKRICLEAGADDVGFVAIDRAEIDDQRHEILKAFPNTRTLISIVCRLNPEPVRSTARSIANQEFHSNYEEINHVARRIVRVLEDQGFSASNPSSAFPMEMDDFPGRIWVVSHKPVAVAAGLGQVGVHRCVIHPKFGSFINLGTILIAVDIDNQSQPVDYNPCLECKLCVAACPVGAIGPDGYFDFSACVTHNYREFMRGFSDWVETIAESRSVQDYRSRVTESETASMWQSLSFKANYKAAYCIAVCPAGDDVIGPFLDDRRGFLENVVDPLKKKEEPIYVIPGSDAESHVQKRFPHKTLRRVRGRSPGTIRQFLFGIKLVFQREASRGIDATFHFAFTGKEPAEATVRIRNRTIEVEKGLIGHSDLSIEADSSAWLSAIESDRNMAKAILFRKVRLKGKWRLLKAFGKCFPK